MKKSYFKKAVSAILSAAMLCSAVPTSAGILSTAADSDVIFASGFENGEGIDQFTGRGGAEIIEATTEKAYSGEYSMSITNREEGWNGPQFRMDTVCEPGVEYTISASVMTEWYNNVMLSWEYTDTAGERKFGNLKTGVSNGDWLTFSDVKFSFTDDMTNVYIYFECSDTATMYIDDFSLAAAPVHEIEQDIPSLKDVYSPYFKFGTAVTTAELAPQSAKDLINKHFNSLTPGNELKPDALLDKNASIEAGNDNPQVNISSARSILNYCRDNNIPVRGHVLVWHSQTPDWFFRENYADDGEWVSKETMLKRMENYIKNVFAALEEEYPTVEFYAWDVVNEAWLDNGSYRTGGTQADNPNNSGWVKVFGDNSFIKPAFEYARKYAPEGCKLYYNDFNEYMPDKTAAIVNMANELKAEGLIDGIGMQSHLDSRTGSDAFPSVSAYKKALAAFAETGLDIQITELDATIARDQPTEANLAGQAQYYSDIMDAILEYEEYISSVVVWGTTDDKSWRAWGYPLLFDAEYKAKESFYAIVDGLEVPDVTTTTTTTTESASTTTTTTSSTPPVDILYGDANNNGEVEVADAVYILQGIADPGNEKYAITDENKKQADANASGAVDTEDAMAIQLYKADIIPSLPPTGALA